MLPERYSLFWSVPSSHIKSYLLEGGFALVALPLLFGYMLSPLGLLINFVLWDFIYYYFARRYQSDLED